MSKTKDWQIDEPNKRKSVESYLGSSETLQEFIYNAGAEIAEHILQTTGREPLSDDVKDKAEELWDEWTSSQVPF